MVTDSSGRCPSSPRCCQLDAEGAFSLHFQTQNGLSIRDLSGSLPLHLWSSWEGMVFAAAITGTHSRSCKKGGKECSTSIRLTSRNGIIHSQCSRRPKLGIPLLYGLHGLIEVTCHLHFSSFFILKIVFPKSHFSNSFSKPYFVNNSSNFYFLFFCINNSKSSNLSSLAFFLGSKNPFLLIKCWCHFSFWHVIFITPMVFFKMFKNKCEFIFVIPSDGICKIDSLKIKRALVGTQHYCMFLLKIDLIDLIDIHDWFTLFRSMTCMRLFLNCALTPSLDST